MKDWKEYLQYFKDFFNTLAGKLTAILAFAVIILIALSWFGAGIPREYLPLAYIVVIGAMLIYLLQPFVAAAADKQKESQPALTGLSKTAPPTELNKKEEPPKTSVHPNAARIAYLDAVIEDSRPLRLVGLDERAGDPTTVRLSLEDIYVALNTRTMRREMVEGELKSLEKAHEEINNPITALEALVSSPERCMVLLGFPGTGESFVIELNRGDNTIELWCQTERPKIFVRFLFNEIKEKKIDWISISPSFPNDPVSLVTNEEVATYYRFSLKKPLKIKITGPTTLRIFNRVENHYQMKGRIDYRLQVKEDGKVKNTYQLSSIRSDVTVYKKNCGRTPGKAKEILITVPGGTHVYEILPLDKDKDSILGKVLFPKKDIRLKE